MSLVFVDGFDEYDVVQDADRKWTAVSLSGGTSDITYQPAGGRFGGGAMSFVGGTDIVKLFKVFKPSPVMTMGFALRLELSPQGAIVFYDWLGSARAQLSVAEDNTLAILAADGTILAQSTDLGLALNQEQWFYIEWQIDVTNGRSEVRVNEELWMVVEDYPFEQGNSFRFGEAFLTGSALIYTIDDVYILNGEGTKNNDFLGDVRIDTLVPAADTIQADFTPLGGGENFAEIDDPGLDRDDSYNFAESIGARDMFQFDALSETPKEIHAVVATIAARKSEAGTRGLRAVIDPGTPALGPERLITTEYLYYQTIWEQNPETGADWLKENVDALTAGYEIGPTE